MIYLIRDQRVCEEVLLDLREAASVYQRDLSVKKALVTCNGNFYVLIDCIENTRLRYGSHVTNVLYRHISYTLDAMEKTSF
jgi:hypothetical protein